MKHAVIILAHKDFQHLFHLAEYFCRECLVYIHIDKRVKVSMDEIKPFHSLPYVSIYRKYRVHWGGFSILKCEMYMLREVLRRDDVEFVHMLSGQDYPLVPLSEFLDFFKKNPSMNYLQYVPLPNPKWERGTYTRFQYYYPHDWLVDGKKSKPFIRRVIDFQKRHNIKRRIPDTFDHLYGNSQWFSITREATETLVNYTKKHPKHYKRLKYTFAPEESYIATVLVNVLGYENFSRWNHRYIRWKNENGNNPAILDATHFHYLFERFYLLARKFDMEYSRELIRLIDNYMINEQEEFSVSSTGAWIYNGYRQYSYNETFVRIVIKICQLFGVKSILDAGCGSGMYVAKLRSMNINATGYDANPFTEELSSHILPPNDEPCGVADLTEDWCIPDPFDMVICKDVIQCIPDNYISKAMENISIASRKIILLYSESNDYDSSYNLAHKTLCINWNIHPLSDYFSKEYKSIIKIYVK